MYTCELFLLMQQANVRHQSVNLLLAERILERGHSTLAIGNDLSEFRIRQLLDHRGAKVWNVHAFSNFRAAAVLTVAHGALRPERNTASRAVWPGASPHNRDRSEERRVGKEC